jgi:prepilin-type N-terminal cleavage/methylation domain-containing protein
VLRARTATVGFIVGLKDKTPVLFMQSLRKKIGAFTLIELLVVIAIIALLPASGPCLHAQIPPPGAAVPSVQLVAPDPTALEGTSTGAFTLFRNGPTTNDLTVNLAISGTASNGVDYATIQDKVIIPTGSPAVDIIVSPIIDTVRRGNKTVVLSVVTNAAYGVGYQRRATVLIVDDVYDVPPPTVTLTSPTNGSGFDDPPSITLQAEASDTGVLITSVSFYANDLFLGKSTTSPYSLVWSNPPAGKLTLFARAVNQVGDSTLSAPVQITITDTVPVVTITSPTNGQNFAVHANITISANATDADDSIQKVSFYANDHLLGVATNAPYSLVWSNAPAGIFLLRASAVDQSGDHGSSKPVMINVSRFPGFGPRVTTP